MPLAPILPITPVLSIPLKALVDETLWRSVDDQHWDHLAMNLHYTIINNKSHFLMRFVSLIKQVHAVGFEISLCQNYVRIVEAKQDRQGTWTLARTPFI